MRIGINLLFMIPGVVGGTEVYAAELVKGLARCAPTADLVVFVNREAASWCLPSSTRVTRVVCPVDGVNRSARYLFEQTVLHRMVRDHGVEVLHSLGYVAPLKLDCPSVVSVPDLNFSVMPDFPLARRLALGFFVSQSIACSDRTITISEHSRQQIIRLYGVAPETVTVTYLASSVRKPPGEAIRAFRETLAIKRPYVLAFGSASPHKNIPRLIEAFGHAKRRHDLPHILVVAGHMPPRFRPPQHDWLVFTGYLDDGMRTAAIAGAEMFVFPSLYEGFGMPLLEAMACEVPVVCSKAACLPEVGGDAAVYFDPTSVLGMSDALADVVASPALRSTLVERSRTQLKRFSWDATARQTLDVYERTIAESSRAITGHAR